MQVHQWMGCCFSDTYQELVPMHCSRVMNFADCNRIPYIVGIFRGYTFSRKCLEKRFHGFNFRGIAPFCSMHACDIKFAVINVRGTCLIRENHKHLYTLEIYPLMYTVYNTVYSGLFSRRLYFANSQFNSCSRKAISRIEILNHASSHINCFFTIFIFEDWLCFREIREI